MSRRVVDLGGRERRVLALTVRHHISSGEPVGSRFLAKQLDMEVSPATIRNTMADLEDKGYLRQTHASSGRVPTDRGYRFYVDELRGAGTDPPAEVAQIKARLGEHRGEIDELIRETSRTLSEVSRHVGLVRAPQVAHTRAQRLDFRRVGERRVLVILVAEPGLVQTRLLETDEDLVQEELDSMARHWNERFSGQPLREVRRALVRVMEEERAEFDVLFRRAVELGRQALSGESQGSGLHLDGAANILDDPEFASPARMRVLLRAIEEKGRLCHLLDRCLEEPGVRILIGAELPVPELQGLSLVAAPYRQEGRALGVLGVIGPTRMEYARIIPIVEYTASRLSAELSVD